MSIWTYSRAILLTVCALIAGCTQIRNAEFLSSDGPKPANALAVVVMEDGAVTLMPPSDYCIDKSSLKPRFALMARCDTLGARTASDAPLVLITATLVPLEESINVPTAADLATALEPNKILQQSDQDGLALVQTESATGLNGISERHWRGVFVVNGILVGLALYAPRDGSVSGEAGAAILTGLAERTTAQTSARIKARSIAAVEPEPTAPSNTE